MFLTIGRDFPTGTGIHVTLYSKLSLSLSNVRDTHTFTPVPATFHHNLTEKGPSIIFCRGDNLMGDIHKNTAHAPILKAQS